MTILWAKQALTDQGWQQDVRVELDGHGRIASVCAAQPPAGQRVAILLPAPANAHSHAFQRALAGLTERRGPDPHDTFWSWRRLMFRFLAQLTPDHIEAICAYVQMEMLEAGFATNVEFHYLHHQPDGTPYANLAETSTRVIAAAAQTGIGLTLLPVHYQFGGCDRRALNGGQLRFGNDCDRFGALWQGARAALAALAPDARIGVAPHSLRAVPPESLPQTIALAPDGPIHMHLAEQRREVAEVLAARGLRPVEWLLENAPVDGRWCLVHCTQMTPRETRALAGTGAVAGLCPITECNLGDGIFDGIRWQQAGGRIAIGSDSNIRISLAEELRLLDYSQRLRDHSRAAFATPRHSSGRWLFEQAARGGAQAAGRGAGRGAGRIAVGEWGDLLALEAGAVDLAGRRGDTILDCFIFAGDTGMVGDVWSAGRHLVRQGRHVAHDEITARYRRALAQLGSDL